MALGPAYGVFQERIQSTSIEAAGNLSAYQHRFVTINGNGQLELTTNANGPAEGVLQNTPSAQGQVAIMAYAGRVEVESGAAVTHGAKVACNNTGQVTVAGTGAHVLGTAITAASGVGELVEVLLISQHILV